MYKVGDRVTVLSNGKAYRGQVYKLPRKPDGDYQVLLPSGAVWLVAPMWLRPRTVRDPRNF